MLHTAVDGSPGHVDRTDRQSTSSLVHGLRFGLGFQQDGTIGHGTNGTGLSSPAQRHSPADTYCVPVLNLAARDPGASGMLHSAASLSLSRWLVIPPLRLSVDQISPMERHPLESRAPALNSAMLIAVIGLELNLGACEPPGQVHPGSRASDGDMKRNAYPREGIHPICRIRREPEIREPAAFVMAPLLSLFRVILTHDDGIAFQRTFPSGEDALPMDEPPMNVIRGTDRPQFPDSKVDRPEG
ncbi:uncharacterized protein N7459_007359 [Penicillium hispanicum]|uniref:uncharacterized protein n=1 Tax=Penicillium hispanicum TaxID=1080232 RepID=UPI002541EFDB|nr:uncharacterized protein N7459_007359 [Penicillium hispanicum]KAJ5578395.1 hypothetical protein N7459_007359 [Penicillium hispanicum]